MQKPKRVALGPDQSKEETKAKEDVVTKGGEKTKNNVKKANTQAGKISKGKVAEIQLSVPEKGFYELDVCEPIPL